MASDLSIPGPLDHGPLDHGPAGGEELTAWRTAGFWRQARRFARHWGAVFGLVFVVVVALAALLAPVLTPYGPTEFTADALQGPSRSHPFGTDELGRDVLTRVLYGARISPGVGVLAIGLAGAIGTALGLIAGYARGVLDAVVMRAMDILLAFPGILLAIVIVATLGPGLRNAMFAVGIAFIPTFARVVRPDRVPGDPSGRPRTRHRPRDAGCRRRDSGRRRPQLPRPRRGAADGGVGRDAERGTKLPARLLVDRRLPRLRDRAHRARDQPDRRRAPRHARPAPLVATREETNA